MRKGSGFGFPIAGAAVNCLALAITALWALIAAGISSSNVEKLPVSQIAENANNKPPQISEPSKKESNKGSDPPITKKENAKETKQDDPPIVKKEESKEPKKKVPPAESIEAKEPTKINPQAQGKDTPKPPESYTNSIGMKFVWIPPGNFMMGSPKEEKERHANEIQHKVTLTKGFYMGVYAVTQEQWKEFMDNNHSSFKEKGNLPIDNETWEDCQEFIKKLRQKDKKPYRLPTEAEWEYACRAGTTTPFHFGENISTDQANYYGQFPYGNGEKGVSRRKPTPVGSFPANAWGLYDMHGNVRQWCQDCHRKYSPNDVSDPQGPDKKGLHVLRGGTFNNPAGMCRSAYRFWVGDGTRGRNFMRRNSGGFRLCFSVE